MAQAPRNDSSSRSSGRSPARARGRELALWALCHLESYPGEQAARALALFWREPPSIDGDDSFLSPELAQELSTLAGDSQARRWAEQLTSRYLAQPDHFDALIEARSQRWRLARMDRVDRNVLRLCAVELEVEATPRGVVVAEAVRLAARYGSERSAVFVNGIAEALAKQLRDQRGPGSSSSPDGTKA